MIILQDIVLQFGERTLFDHINAHITFDQKIGIVGRNGAGKSTLLDAIAGNIQIDSGQIVTDKKKKIAYLPQHLVLQSTKSVFDETFYVFEEFIKSKKRCDLIEAELESEPVHAQQLLEEYTSLLEKLSHFDEAKALSRTHDILNGLGFTQQQKNVLVSTLSVGWKMRVVLAKLLLADADFYLFDEPTNHLDLSTKEWFCEFLQKSSAGFLLITHDRYFLEKAVSKIFELENGHGTFYDGNFSTYVNQKEKQRAILEAAYKTQQKEIERKEKTIDRFRAKATKATLVKSMIKQLDRIERIEIEPPLPKIRITFPQAIAPGKTVLTLKNLSYSFGNHSIFKNVSATISRGQKVALIAPNGTGKTTLFNVITGKYPLQSGEIIFGHNVKAAFFEQEQSAVMKSGNTILQEVSDACPDIREETIRAFLGSFLFSGNDVNKKISVLSGGEKNRVAMVKVLLQKANLLFLDEPTNHLDLVTKEILLQALQQYEGTMLIVSHDHTFIQNLATDILELTPQGLHHFPGNYELFLEYKKQSNAAQVTPVLSTPQQHKNVISSPVPTAQVNRKDISELRKKIARLEKAIEKLEQDQKKLSDSFTDFTYGTDAYAQHLKKLEEITTELTQKINDWENLQTQLDLG